MHWKCGNVELTIYHLHSYVGESSFIISPSLCKSQRRPLPDHLQPYLRPSSLYSAVFILSFFCLFSDTSLLLMAEPPSWLFVKVISERERSTTHEKAIYITERHGWDRESKGAHSFPSKDLTAALKEACLLFSSFSVARAWRRVKIKRKEVHSPMNAEQPPLQLFSNTCQIHFQ